MRTSAVCVSDDDHGGSRRRSAAAGVRGRVRNVALGWLGVLAVMVIGGPGGDDDDDAAVEASCGMVAGVSEKFTTLILLSSAFQDYVWTNAMQTEVVVRFRVSLPWCA